MDADSRKAEDRLRKRLPYFKPDDYLDEDSIESALLAVVYECRETYGSPPTFNEFKMLYSGIDPRSNFDDAPPAGSVGQNEVSKLRTKLLIEVFGEDFNQLVKDRKTIPFGPDKLEEIDPANAGVVGAGTGLLLSAEELEIEGGPEEVAESEGRPDSYDIFYPPDPEEDEANRFESGRGVDTFQARGR